MDQSHFLEVYGFQKGKYTYWGKNVTLWRRLTNNPNGKVKDMPLVESSGSFGWRIQGDWINIDNMSGMCKKIKLQITTPF